MTYYGPETDMVNHPAHYISDYGLEAITVIEAFKLDYHIGSAVAYLLRAGNKGDELEDLQKARWYLDRKIAHLEGRGTGATPPPPPAMRAQAGSFSNAGMDAARRQMQGSDFRYGPTEIAPHHPIAPPTGLPPETCDNPDIRLGPGPHINAPY